ncbi:MAG: nucleotide exchange factor GrpE [Pseudomonadota bacterium]
MSAQTNDGAPEKGRPPEAKAKVETGEHRPDSLISEDLGTPKPETDEIDVEATAAVEREVALRVEMEELRSNMLRALAEAENVRRRAQRDVADARQYAVTSFARDLLNVSDNFKRALSALDGAGELPEEVKALVEGVQMTERELSTIFKRHGVKPLDPMGERFDPNRHQAMFEMENPDVPHGTVIQVVQTGAMIGDRTLRPAMVGVSKGGPKSTEAKDEATGTSEDAPKSDEGAGDAS